MRRYQGWVADTSRLQGGVPVLPDEFHRPRPLGFLVRVLNTIRPAQPGMGLVEARTRHLDIIDASIRIFFDVLMEFREHWASFQTGEAQVIGQNGQGPSSDPGSGPGSGAPSSASDLNQQGQAAGYPAGAHPHRPAGGNQVADRQGSGEQQGWPAGMVYHQGSDGASGQRPPVGHHTADDPSAGQDLQQPTGTTYQHGSLATPPQPDWVKAVLQAFTQALTNHAPMRHDDPPWVLPSDNKNGVHGYDTGSHTAHGQLLDQDKGQLAGTMYEEGLRRLVPTFDTASYSAASQHPIGVIGERANEAEENHRPVFSNTNQGKDDGEEDEGDEEGDDDEVVEENEEYEEDEGTALHQASSRAKPSPSGSRKGLRTLFSAYPKEDTPLPLGITLRQICQDYPNHLHGSVLDQFREAKWNGHEIWDACRPNGRLNNQITTSKVRPWNYLEGRMRRAKLQSDAEGEEGGGEEGEA